MGYQPSGAASDRAKTQQKMKVSSEVIVLSAEESPTSPMETLKDASLIVHTRLLLQIVPNSDVSDVNTLCGRLLREEKRLRLLTTAQPKSYDFKF